MQIIQVDGTDWGYSFAPDKWLYLTASGLGVYAVRDSVEDLLMDQCFG